MTDCRESKKQEATPPNSDAHAALHRQAYDGTAARTPCRSVELKSHSHTPASDFLRGFELMIGSHNGQKPLSDSASPSERKDYIANPENRLTPDVRTLWRPEDRVLAIGDQHLTQDIKQHTIDNMRRYAQAGAKAIGMELLPQASQKDLDRYRELRGNKASDPKDVASARRTIEDHFKQSQESSTDTQDDRKRAEPALKRTMQIVDAAIDAGIRPVAIEPNISKAFSTDAGYSLMHDGMHRLNADSQSAFDTYTNPTSTEDARNTARAKLQQDLPDWTKSKDFFSTLDEARNAGFDFRGMKLPRPASEDEDSQWNARLHDLRNRTWADQAAKYLKDNPNDRMIMFAGAQHFQYEQRDGRQIPSANERLKAAGFGTTVLQFAGGDFARPDHYNYEFAAAAAFYGRQHNIHPGPDGRYPPAPDSVRSAGLGYTIPAMSAGVAKERFAIAIKPEGAREADYVIHLPH